MVQLCTRTGLYQEAYCTSRGFCTRRGLYQDTSCTSTGFVLGGLEKEIGRHTHDQTVHEKRRVRVRERKPKDERRGVIGKKTRKKSKKVEGNRFSEGLERVKAEEKLADWCEQR